MFSYEYRTRKTQYKEDFIKIRFQSMKRILGRKQAHTYSYGKDTHSLRKKTSYARYVQSHTESYRRIQSYTLRTKRSIHLTNIVKKCSHQAVSKGDEPEHSKRFIIQATFESLDKQVPIRLLVDSGASGPILHKVFVRKNKLLVKKRKMPKRVKNANEEPIPNIGTHYMQPIVLVIGQHAEDIV